MKESKIERRELFGTMSLVRSEGDEDSRTVEGYALKFDSESKSLGFGRFKFREIIDKSALDDADLSDVIARTNHDNNFLLARTESKTLQLKIDDVGLHYRFEAAKTTAGDDLLENLRRGDISKSSFAFELDENGSEWENREDDDKVPLRRITKFSKIVDVSPVVNPAYPDTSVAKRSFDEAFPENPDKGSEENREKNSKESNKKVISKKQVSLTLDLYKQK